LRRNLSRDFSLTLTVSGRTTRSLRSTPPGKFSHKFLWKVFHSLATVIKTRRRTPPLWKRGVCDQTSVVYPCVPDNRLRIVKLERVDAIKKLEHRASPPAILQKLGLVDQVFPLSNHHFKIVLKEGVSDKVLLKTIQYFDKGLGDRLFHSFHDGDGTTLFPPPPPPPPPRPLWSFSAVEEVSPPG